MTIPKGWQGSCAPLVYIGQCQTKDIGRYQTYARFWLAANSLVCLFLLAAFIRRCIVVKERFNTIRLLMLKFIAGLVLNIIHDILRSASPNSFGAPPSFTAFLWITSWAPPLGAMVLIATTWMSFSSKNLLARPVITGNWVLYLVFMIPFVTATVILAPVSGISYKVYLIAMSALLAGWAAMLLLTFAITSYYGYKTLKQLKGTADKFAVHQHVRAYVIISGSLFFASIILILNGLFLKEIDTVSWRFLLVNSSYRANAFIIYFLCGLYAWVATSRVISQPNTKQTCSTSSSRIPMTDSHGQPNTQQTSSKNGVSAQSSEESPRGKDEESGTKKQSALSTSTSTDREVEAPADTDTEESDEPTPSKAEESSDHEDSGSAVEETGEDDEEAGEEGDEESFSSSAADNQV